MTTGVFKPKGPFPLWLADFEKDTIGWSLDLMFMYLRLLVHLWSQGGYIPDDDDYLVEAMGMHKARGYRRKLRGRVHCHSHPRVQAKPGRQQLARPPVF